LEEIEMEKLLIKMVDGGLVDYDDDSYSYGGCPTCDYGSSYITEIDMTLTKHKIHIKTNQMYEYVLSEGDMMKLLLSNYETIQTMTEKEFIDWLKVKLLEIADEDELEKYNVIEL
jgi:hypothetical protein